MQVYFSFFVVFFLKKQGDLYDHESLLKAIKQVDVVISTVGAMQLADQVKIIDAIKEAGNIKVSCFLFFLGNEVELVKLGTEGMMVILNIVIVDKVLEFIDHILIREFGVSKGS